MAIILTIHPIAMDEEALYGLRSIGDANLKRLAKFDQDRWLGVLEVSKTQNVDYRDPNRLSLGVETGQGIRFVLLTQVRV